MPDLSFAERVLESRRSRACELPDTAAASRFLGELLGVLFPHFSQDAYYSPREIEARLSLVYRDLTEVLLPVAAIMPLPMADTVTKFAQNVPAVWEQLWLDADAIYKGDPAAESVDEVISAYPGFLAIAIYRISHEFSLLGVPIFPRVLTEIAHQRTGVDIHPGATIGASFCIDHGTGIVIGQTTHIGDHVKLYQGVTLGALSVDKTLSHSQRHPTIQDRVVIYSNATILGGSTLIGHDSVIGGNVWLTNSVPPFSRVYHKGANGVRHTNSDAVVTDYFI